MEHESELVSGSIPVQATHSNIGTSSVLGSHDDKEGEPETLSTVNEATPTVEGSPNEEVSQAVDETVIQDSVVGGDSTEGGDAIDQALAGKVIDYSSDEENPENSQSKGSQECDVDKLSSDIASSSGSGSDSDSELDCDGKEVGIMGDDDDETEGMDTKTPMKTKNEIEAPVPDLPEGFVLDDKTEIEFIGTLTQVVENTAIVRAAVSAEYRVLEDNNTVLCFGDRTVLGMLYETFGRVHAPFYSIKFKAEQEDTVKDVTGRKGQNVYYVVPASNFLLTSQVRKFKGSDASNVHDEEVPLDQQEFSDDEKEMEAKQSKKKRKTKKGSRQNHQNQGPPPQYHSQSRFLGYPLQPQVPQVPQQFVPQTTAPYPIAGFHAMPMMPSLPGMPSFQQQQFQAQSPRPYDVPSRRAPTAYQDPDRSNDNDHEGNLPY